MSFTPDDLKVLDKSWMRVAVDHAWRAIIRGDSGYGCVIVLRGTQVIGIGNGSEKQHDCTCHSEIIAIREAQGCHRYLADATLYSTFEPCAMCCGAICHSKIGRVVWGASRRDLPDLYRQRLHNAGSLLGDTSTPPQLADGILREACIQVTRARPWLSNHYEEHDGNAHGSHGH